MEKTLDFIKEKIGNFVPEICVILGSGLGELADEYCDISILYSEIPNFMASTVKGHKGKLVFAEVFGKKVVFMQGRSHFYEGHTMQEITYPVKVMKKLGVKHLILTNAAGGVSEKLSAGDLMLITDHINFMGQNPLVGANEDTMGERFPDMTEIYKKELIIKAEKCAKDLGISLKKGIYFANSGPSYETPAEINMVRILGADAVGMSTVPEAIVGNWCGLNILGISCISNAASAVDGKKLSHEDVIHTTNRVKSDFKKLVVDIIKNL